MAREGGAAPEATDPGDLADELGRGQRVRKALYAVLARSGLPEITFHNLRHSYTTIAAAPGVPPHVIQANLGLTDISLTMNVYTHVGEEAKRDAADRIDALFRRTS